MTPHTSRCCSSSSAGTAPRRQPHCHRPTGVRVPGYRDVCTICTHSVPHGHAVPHILASGDHWLLHAGGKALGSDRHHMGASRATGGQSGTVGGCCVVVHRAVVTSMGCSQCRLDDRCIHHSMGVHVRMRVETPHARLRHANHHVRVNVGKSTLESPTPMKLSAHITDHCVLLHVTGFHSHKQCQTCNWMRKN